MIQTATQKPHKVFFQPCCNHHVAATHHSGDIILQSTTKEFRNAVLKFQQPQGLFCAFQPQTQPAFQGFWHCYLPACVQRCAPDPPVSKCPNGTNSRCFTQKTVRLTSGIVAAFLGSARFLEVVRQDSPEPNGFFMIFLLQSEYSVASLRLSCKGPGIFSRFVDVLQPISWLAAWHLKSSHI